MKKDIQLDGKSSSPVQKHVRPDFPILCPCLQLPTGGPGADGSEGKDLTPFLVFLDTVTGATLQFFLKLIVYLAWRGFYESNNPGKNILGSIAEQEKKPIAESSNKCTICDQAQRTCNMAWAVITYTFNSHIKPTVSWTTEPKFPSSLHPVSLPDTAAVPAPSCTVIL